MTNFQHEEDLREYTVVKNGGDQFSIWLADQEVPAGWEAVGQKGSKAACLEYIEQTWTDMTPRSVRNARAVKSDICSRRPPPHRGGRNHARIEMLRVNRLDLPRWLLRVPETGRGLPWPCRDRKTGKRPVQAPFNETVRSRFRQ